ncbi:putative glyoxalase superfamily protein PhnB [Propionibacteriaceae bacterium ES.041]|uniref:VOC family protein n=1 Tax=Enemella evansiae TaxID=2016499 RepID=UPI000B96AC65|nr:VOC family protein [Enemella evansiae]OYN99331.1 glyoxalase [Enemella evansiae]PFG67095.1 putative glyoxalase superfamily protein PhnB [Propionibacteriaceae bacterium ES.041]
MDLRLTPKLLLDDPDAAITFYTRAFDADLTFRMADDRGVVVHAELELEGGGFALGQSVAEWGWQDPGSTGGSPVLILLTVPDPDATAARMVTGGAEIVIPIEDRPYGRREGRVRDPFGHLWVLGTEL